MKKILLVEILLLAGLFSLQYLKQDNQNYPANVSNSTAKTLNNSPE
ncbi:MAG: hypothetical protein ACJA19_000622 [Bacteroidia bacterium]|jgi:hypothetical protein